MDVKLTTHPVSSAEIKNAWSYTSTTLHVFIVWCFIKHRNYFTEFNHNLLFQAFGVGAFEDDDEDIYVSEDMSQYDFSLESEPTTSKQKQQTPAVVLAAYYSGGTLVGFVLGTNAMTQKKYFPPPVLPQGFKPVHVTRKSRFEPAPTEKLSLNNEQQSHTSRKKGVQQQNLTATDRAQILSDATPKSGVQKHDGRSPTQLKYDRLPADELKRTENFDVSKKGYSHFQPFLAHPEKQKRYEQYLTLCKVGQKGKSSIMLPSKS
jgi:G patch domain-containing protein 1